MIKLKLLFTCFTLIVVSGCSSTSPYLYGGPIPNKEELKESLVLRQKYVERHPDLSEETKINILHNNVAIGFTKEQVSLLWGEPLLILRNPNAHANEIWFYRGYHFNDYLYFNGDILTAKETGNSIEEQGFQKADILWEKPNQ